MPELKLYVKKEGIEWHISTLYVLIYPQLLHSHALACYQLNFLSNLVEYSSILQLLHSPIDCGWQVGLFILRGPINDQLAKVRSGHWPFHVCNITSKQVISNLSSYMAVLLKKSELHKQQMAWHVEVRYLFCMHRPHTYRDQFCATVEIHLSSKYGFAFMFCLRQSMLTSIKTRVILCIAPYK